MRVITVCLFLSIVTLGAFTLQAGIFLSPTDIDLLGSGSKNSHRILITEKTAQKLDIFDKTSDKIVRTIPLPDVPTGSVCSADGKKIYTTVGLSEGKIIEIDSKSGKTLRIIDAGHSPNSPLLSPDQKTLYICNRFTNSVAAFDLSSGEKIKDISVKREPLAATLTPDGKRMFIINHMPAGRADTDYVASKLSVIDTEKLQVIKHIKLVNGAEGMRGITVSPDGNYVYATHLMARYQVPTTQIERGWINTNALSVIDVSDNKLLYTVLLDDVNLGFSNPWAVQASTNGKYLAVTSAGGHQIRLIDLPAMIAKIDKTNSGAIEASNSVHLNAHNDLSFISDVSKRIQLEGNGPRSILFSGNEIWVGEYFSNSLGKVTITNGTVSEVQSIPLGPEVAMTDERQGEIYFNDATLCFQQWQSCASCHSDDGRTDALNWDLLNDGIGNPKNAKSLLYSHQTPPVMSLGVRDRAETAVRAGIKYIQFAVRPEEDAEKIDAYLKSLTPVPSPDLVNGGLSESAKYGEIFFEKYGCIQCHSGDYYTDLKSHNLGTGIGQDAEKAFDTPTLIEVWRTAPYMHDGRVTKIEDVIRIHNPINGNKPIPEQELNDLAAYVRSL